MTQPTNPRPAVELKPCPTCGALPCDQVTRPASPVGGQSLSDLIASLASGRTCTLFAHECELILAALSAPSVAGEAVAWITANDIAAIIESRADVDCNRDGGSAWLNNASQIAQEIYLAFAALSPTALEQGSGAFPAKEPVIPTGALADIAAERQRQVQKEGWTAEHDDGHEGGEMALAAATYAMGAALPPVERSVMDQFGDKSATPSSIWQHWPWDFRWWKPRSPRRDLVRAGALIVAEIDRLDRKEAGK